MSEVKTPDEIISPTGESDNESAEDTTHSFFVTGYNESRVITPIQCGNCDTEFPAAPDTVATDGENLNYCPACGTNFTDYDDEF